jgi:hypothetical protein
MRFATPQNRSWRSSPATVGEVAGHGEAAEVGADDEDGLAGERRVVVPGRR